MCIDAATKRIVAIYLELFLWRRSPATRDRQAEMTKAKLSDMAMDSLRQNPLRSLLEGSVPAAVEVASDVNGLMASHWRANNFQRWLFYSMSWAVLRCDEPQVLIPDCGMVRWRGPLDVEAEFYFPLSDKRMLVASWLGAPSNEVKLLSAPSAYVGEINQLGFEQAGRFVYGRESATAPVKRPPSPRSTTLENLGVIGGPNPLAAELNELRRRYGNVGNSDDDPNRYFCVAPGAGEQHCHRWGQELDVPVVQEVTTPGRFCEWCRALERKHTEGRFEFDDSELLRRTAPNKALRKNWWEFLKVEGTHTCIVARGVVPPYCIPR